MMADACGRSRGGVGRWRGLASAWRTREIGLAVLLLAAVPPPLQAQRTPDDTQIVSRMPAGPVSYVSYGRRDPFVPLIGAYAGDQDEAPRLEQLQLTGVFEGAPGNSLVVLEDPARRGHFVRIGETLGNARLVRILPEAAVFLVDEYGSMRQDTLRLVPERHPGPQEIPASDPAPEDGE